MSTEDLIRRCYAAYLARDRQTVEEIFSDDLVFTSPYDDHIDKTAYFEKCWAGGDRFADFQIEKLFVEGEEAFVRYRIELKDGSKFRNTELIRCQRSRIKEIEVYFGREENQTDDETEIRVVLEARAEAVRQKKSAEHIRLYADDAVIFGLAPPLQSRIEQKNVRAWFETFRGAIGYEVNELRLTSSDEVATARSLNRISGTNTDGKEIEMWVRETLTLRKIDGTWKITHEHTSVPFYMDGTMKAAVDLKP